MPTQSSVSSQTLTEDGTGTRADRPEARQIRDNGLAAARPRGQSRDEGTLPTHGRKSTRRQSEGNLSRSVSRAMVALYKEYVGRGPTQARAYVREDVITIVLRDTMTKAERTLADEGEEALIRSMRHVLQGKLRVHAKEIVERWTGQHVLALLSDLNVHEDVAIQTFVLEPRRVSR